MQTELRLALVCLGGLAAACSGGGGGGTLGGGGGGSGDLPPTIAGNPPDMAVVGEFFTFTPTARDPEGRTLTFTIHNKPGWAHFRTVDGRLSGTPEFDQIGAHVEIAISVSDGHSKVALPAFTINVIEGGDGTATLSWNPPTENTDGSALTNLSGYRIYYGRHKHALDRTVVLDNPGLTRYVVEGLTPGRWHFAITSVNRKGVESSRSKSVSKKVR
jgi:hypothetical protein